VLRCAGAKQAEAEQKNWQSHELELNNPSTLRQLARIETAKALISARNADFSPQGHGYLRAFCVL